MKRNVIIVSQVYLVPGHRLVAARCSNLLSIDMLASGAACWVLKCDFSRNEGALGYFVGV